MRYEFLKSSEEKSMKSKQEDESMKELPNENQANLVSIFLSCVNDFIPSLIKQHKIGITGIFGNNYSELSHSNVIASLLQPGYFPCSESIGSSFLDIIGNKCGGRNFSDEHILSVEREKSTDKNRRIDIYIVTDHYNIIVENKVNAGDQENQIEDYLDYVEEISKDKETIVVYLTLYGYEPSTYSISPKRFQKLVVEKRIALLSYSEDIMSWLNQIEANEILKHEIEVYKYVVEEICLMTNVTVDFVRKYNADFKNFILENPKDARDCINGMKQILIINLNLKMLKVLFEILKEENRKVYFIIGQTYLFEDYNDFERDILVNIFQSYGICVETNNGVKIGLEYDNALDGNGSWYFGFMKGKEGSQAEVRDKEYVDKRKLTPDWQGCMKHNSEWWGEYSKANNWINIDDDNMPYIIKVWFDNQIKYTEEGN